MKPNNAKFFRIVSKGFILILIYFFRTDLSKRFFFRLITDGNEHCLPPFIENLVNVWIISVHSLNNLGQIKLWVRNQKTKTCSNLKTCPEENDQVFGNQNVLFLLFFENIS